MKLNVPQLELDCFAVTSYSLHHQPVRRVCVRWPLLKLSLTIKLFFCDKVN